MSAEVKQQGPAPAAEVLTCAQAGAQLQVSPDTVERWIKEGHLRAFVRPGLKPGHTPGKRTYRIWLDDWRAFVRRNTTSGVAVALPAPPTISLATQATGPDGVSRRSRRRS